MTATLLGSGGWMATKSRATSTVQVVGGSAPLLFDAGTGVHALLRAPRFDELHIAVTHFHLDHVVGLGYLPAAPQDCRITVYAPGQLLMGSSSEDVLTKLFREPFHSAPFSAFVAECRELQEGPNDMAGLQVDVRVQPSHPGGSVGLRVGDLAYCTDTEPDVGVIDFAAGSRVLLHEAWHPRESGHGHSSAIDAARLADAAGVRELVLCHIHPIADNPDALLAAAQSVFARTTVGYDGLKI